MSSPIVPLVVATALFMETMDSSLLATALPAIAKDLGVDPIALKLAVTSYLVSLAIFIPVSGWIADRFGASTTFRLALAVFALSSLGCASATSLQAFVGWRFLQGMGGALMVPVGRLVLLRAVPKSELVQALSYLTIPSLVGPLIGPLIAGYLATYADWRWIFVAHVPVALLGIVLASLHFSDETPDRVPLDAKGFLLTSIALPGLVLGAALAGKHVAPPMAAAFAFIVGAVAALLYVRHARRTSRPLLDLSLFDHPTFDAGVVGGVLFRMGIGASAFLMPLMLQIGFGLDAFTSGLITFTGALGALTMKTLAPRLLRRIGFRTILIWNGLLAAASLAVTAMFTPTTPHLVMSAILLVAGLLRSLQFSSLNAIAYADIPSERTSAATSLSSVAQQVSLSFGVAIGAMALEASAAFAGRVSPGPADFSFALMAVAAISWLAVFRMLRLPADAGSEISGAPRSH
jgi:EmrB/QacA subfamily drug resistance transporter